MSRVGRAKWIGRAGTLVDWLRARYRENPDAPAVTLVDPEKGDRTWSIGQLLGDAQAMRDRLAERGVRPGEVVPIILPTSAELIVSYWACQLIGAVPTVLGYPTSKIDPTRYYRALPQTLARCDVRIVLTYEELAGRLESLAGSEGRRWEPVEWEAAASLTGPNPARFHRGNSDDVAILQHSSGTTGLQKGVALRHGDVIRQVRWYGERIGLSNRDVIVSWLPLYHDMGLIASFVMPVMAGVHVVMMSPFVWVANPHLLFTAIQRYRGTLVWQPNFAYNFLAQRVEDRHLEGVRLDTVRGWINCSEPTYASSHRLFAERFAEYGVRAESLTVCYAMAENTFAISQSGFGVENRCDRIDGDAFRRTGRAIRRGEVRDGNAAGAPKNHPDTFSGVVEMLSAGPVLGNQQMRIVDPGGSDLPDRCVGEIAVRSDCMMRGYHRRPDLTAKIWRDDYFLTGDLGYLAEGHLYVVGRKKDLIIAAGKNIYPNDVEQIINDTPGIVPGRAVVFGVLNEGLGTEELAVVAERSAEAGRSDKEILLEIRRRVAEATEVVVRYAKLVDPGWLIKTTSGKLSRSANREKFIETFVQSAEVV